MSEITNIMTVDVEDYFQVSAFEGVVPRSEWDKLSSRVVKNTLRVLDIFDEYDVKATFFVLAWVAERYPLLIREIVDNGHELANHGYDHKRITGFSRDELSHDLLKSKNILEEITSVEVKGYRAPSYSIVESNIWAHEVLHECGYLYSSSVYPIKHDLYGIPDAPRFKYQATKSGIVEYPISTTKVLGRNIPCGGGGFFRLYPYRLSKWAIQRINNSERQSCVFYFHPWEIDPGQPRQRNIPAKTKLRHYLNLDIMESRLRNLLENFQWTRMDSML